MDILFRLVRNRCFAFAVLTASVGSGAGFAWAEAESPDDSADQISDESTIDTDDFLERLEQPENNEVERAETRNRSCFRYNGDAFRCQQAFGCNYDYRSNRCFEGGGGGGGGSGAGAYCERFNFDYRQCVNSGCMFDGQSGSCYGNWNPNTPNQPYPPHPYPPQPYPQPDPNRCSQFNFNQYQCQNAGCFFDHRNGVCFAQGNPYPGPIMHRFVCTAVDVGFEEHYRGHRGMGRNQYEAQQAAMGDCLRFHGRCRIRDCRQD